jgi:hypothetical protein
METNIEEVSAEPVRPPAVPPPAPAPELPRAAVVVAEGKTQREIELEGKLTDADKALRDKDLSLMQLGEENRQLKRVTPQPSRKKKSAIEAFFDAED